MYKIQPNINFDLESDQPLYSQVFHWLKCLIDKEFEHEQRFFTERELISMLKVSQPTIRRALQELVNQRFLRRRVGQGTFVQKFPPLRLVGFIAPYWHSPIFMQQVNAFAEACDRYDCNLRMHYIRQGESARDMARSLMADPHVERMILWGQSIERAEILSEEFMRRDFRCVSAFPYCPDFSGYSVGVDIHAGVCLALDYLTRLGHERIAFIINEPSELITISVRVEALRSEVEKRHLSKCTFISCESPLWSDSFKAAYEAMDRVMSLTPRPTAVVPISATGAWAALRYASKHQLQVPRDFSVFSFANLTGSDILPTALTCLDTDWNKVADSALDILWKDSDAQPSGQTLIQPTLIERESTSAVAN